MSNISLGKIKLSDLKNNTVGFETKEITKKEVFNEEENVILIKDLGDFVVIPVDENGNPKK